MSQGCFVQRRGGDRTSKLERRIREREKKYRKKILKTDFIKFIKIMIFLLQSGHTFRQSKLTEILKKVLIWLILKLQVSITQN